MELKCKKCLYRFCSDNGMPYCPSCDCEDLEELDELCIRLEEDIILEEHHIHPKFMDNRKGNGEKFRITKKQHSIIHGKIMKWIWECISAEDKEKVINHIINKSKIFLEVDYGRK